MLFQIEVCQISEWMTYLTKLSPRHLKNLYVRSWDLDPCAGFMPAWEKMEMQAEEGRRKCGVLFVSLIVLWHQHLILSLRTFPIVSAEPRKLLIAEKGRIYASIRERAEWCCALRLLVPSLRRELTATLLFTYPSPHPSSPALHKSLSHGWLCNPMDCSPPGSTVHGIFPSRILAIPFSRGFSWSRDWTCISFIAGRVFTTEPPGNTPLALLQIKSTESAVHIFLVCPCASYFPSLSLFFS